MSEICILYCLAKREMTIYSVKKFIINYFGAYTRPSHGTIHPSLKKLLQNGYVSVSDVLSDGGKKSSYYSITEKGKKYLTELLISDINDNPATLINEIYMRLSAIGYLNNENKTILIQNSLKILDLQALNLQRRINDNYGGYDDFQIDIMKQSLKQISDFINFVKGFKI